MYIHVWMDFTCKDFTCKYMYQGYIRVLYACLYKSVYILSGVSEMFLVLSRVTRSNFEGVG